MSDLSQETCEACRFDAPRVEAAEAAELAQQIPNWDQVEQDGIPRLRRVFALSNYAQAVALTLAIAEMAEREDHHPLIVLEWGRVTVEWWSHKIRGLHRNDFVAAAKTDRLFAELASTSV